MKHGDFPYGYANVYERVNPHFWWFTPHLKAGGPDSATCYVFAFAEDPWGALGVRPSQIKADSVSPCVE